MEPLAIIKPFHERKDLPTGFIPCVIRLVMDELIFQGTEEALRHCVVVTIPSPAHTRRDIARGEFLLRGHATLLGTLIRVMNQAGLDVSMTDRHGQRHERQLLIGLLAHGPVETKESGVFLGLH
jgi:hypothetical protein